MIGAIVGDVIGSVYEWDNIFDTDFPIPDSRGHVTDDSVMTVAVAEALEKAFPLDFSKGGMARFRMVLVQEFRHWYRLYPNVGYGKGFRKWLDGENGYQPYGSYGNGAGMRVSPVAWACATEEEVLLLSDAVTAITHDHPDAIKGARAISLGTFLALHGFDKKTIADRLSSFYPELSDAGAVLVNGKGKGFDFSCRGTVPLAIAAFLKGNSEEAVIRLAVSLGGDSDTIACMAGSLAEAFYHPSTLSSMEKSILLGIPEDIKNTILSFHLRFETKKAEAIEEYLKKPH